MKLKTLTLTLLLTSTLLSCSKESGYIVEAIEDGDTITVNLNGTSQRIQLSGIDAPENTENAKFKLDLKKTPNKEALLEIGTLATDFLKTQITIGEKVQLQGDLSKQDKYGRIPAIVINKTGDSVNEKMVAEGYATLLGRYPLEASFKSTLEQAEQAARKQPKGLWKSHAEITNQWGGKSLH